MISLSASADELIVEENIGWLYSNKERSFAAVKDRNDPNSLLTANLVFSTWAMADASINEDVAPFLAELWISRTEDVLLWFQNNHESSFERWLNVQKHIMFNAYDEESYKELTDLRERLIAHLSKYEGKTGIYWAPVNEYLKVLRNLKVENHTR